MINNYEIVIADTSHYEDSIYTERTIDWDVTANKVDGVIMKVGQGTLKDSIFDKSWDLSKRAGLLRGGYWFLDNRYDPKKQAETFVSFVGNDLGELPICADIEHSVSGKYFNWNSWFVFLNRLRDLVGNDKEIMIYTGYYYWLDNTIGAGIPKESLNWFSQFPLWIANYGVASPMVPKPWADWTLWQFTDHADGISYGMESKELDLSYYNGSKEDYYSKFGTQVTDGNIQKENKFSMRVKIR